MLKALVNWYRSRPEQPYVRPWGLAVPVLVLIVCLPLLRPVRYPDPTYMSEAELARLATVQAIVEQRTLAIDQSDLRPPPTMLTRGYAEGRRSGGHYYSKQPPVLAALLAGPYWVMHRLGLSFDRNLALSSYLLTLFGSTLPVAVAGGLVYRLGRLFELRRRWRTLLSFAAVFGSGLVSYATVLNSHAPAAALILATCGALFHAGMARKRGESHGWLVLAGLAAGLAAVIDFGAFVFLFLLVFVILAMRWAVSSRVGGVGWYAFGALPALTLHAMLTAPMTGDFRPGFLHPELQAAGTSAPATQVMDPDEEEAGPSRTTVTLLRAVDGLVGSRGLFSHFPILLLGVGGVATVLHRNWPAATKMMAGVTAAGGLVIIGVYVVTAENWSQPMFSVRWFIPFLPLTVFWGGVWLREKHHAAVWAAAGVVLGFSVLTTVIGATSPLTRCREGQYTAYGAARQLFTGPRAGPAIADK